MSCYEMVRDCVREMIGGYAVGFQNNHVLVVFGYGDIAFYRVAERSFVGDVARRSEADDEGLVRRKTGIYLLLAQIAALGVFAVIARNEFFSVLFLADFIEFFFGAKHGYALPSSMSFLA